MKKIFILFTMMLSINAFAASLPVSLQGFIKKQISINCPELSEEGNSVNFNPMNIELHNFGEEATYEVEYSVSYDYGHLSGTKIKLIIDAIDLYHSPGFYQLAKLKATPSHICR